MPTLTDTTRNALVDELTSLIDAGGAGTLVFETTGDVEVATLTFSADSFPAASSGSADSNAITSDSSAAGGVIDHVMIVSGGAADIMECTIATDSSEDFEISSLTISAGDQVSIAAGGVTITQPAS